MSMGAGVMPFCVSGGEVRFLFHKTFSGRRAGCLVDFGGGGRTGESHRQTAIREFIEETEAMFFAADTGAAGQCDAEIRRQERLLEQLFESTLGDHPDWWCARQPGAGGKPRDWRTFFIEVACRDVGDMNRAWELDDGSRFRKRRELLWVPGGELCEIYRHAPGRLWKRVRQLQGAEETIRMVMRHKTPGGMPDPGVADHTNGTRWPE